MKKIKVTAVSYLNTKPLLYGLLQDQLEKHIDLQLNIPSVCAEKLKSGAVDLGLVPVAIIPELEQPYIISDYCIGTKGAVETVCIYGDRPIEEMSHIYLDYHSRTSVELTKILLRDHWQLSPELMKASQGYIDQIEGRVGGLVIGDRTIGLDKRFKYCYDLGEVWFQHTQLPFVFAAWISNKPLDPEFVQAFNRALAKGIELIPQLRFIIPSPSPDFDLETYFTHHISYDLDAKKRQALALFLDAIPSKLAASEVPGLLYT
ncbi:MAG: menaquinone biosynthesis protein [Bacteroidota bacterium]